MRTRSFAFLGLSITATTLALSLASERDASACGGCFHPPTQTASDITDERMLLSVSTKQTTLYDQIRYTGSPSSFAWVLPIHGTVDVGLSADVLFDSVDAVTATTIQAPASQCSAQPSSCNDAENASAGGAFAADGGATAPGTVTVTKAQNVGPYETVQLHATDSSAINKWLSDNGFAIPATVTPIIDEYVKEGFDFLAMKLLPDQGVQAMRPVRVTSPGAGLSLPLRMAAIGTGASVGITIWVVSEGRYEPQNFPFYHIEDNDLVWDWNLSSSNYTTLRSQHETELGGKGWEIESSIDLSESLISGVIENGGNYYPNGGFGGPVGIASAGDDYLPIPGTSVSADGGPVLGSGGDAGTGDDGGLGETADQVRDDDITALFAGMTGPNVRVTRMRSDIAHAAMTVDFVLQASADQSEVSNNRIVTHSINELCPIYDQCAVVGAGTPAQAAASVSPANNPAAAADANSGGTDGCAVTPRMRHESNLRYASLAGAIGIVLFQLRNRRRNRKQS